MSASGIKITTKVLTENTLLEHADAATDHSKLLTDYKERERKMTRKACQQLNSANSVRHTHFTKLESLNKHTEHKHDGRNSVHSCRDCKRTFSTKTSLDRHMQRSIHTGILPYRCQKCKACFLQRRSLNSHMRHVHLEKQRYTCNECKSTFGRLESLKLHKLTIHDGLRPYVCQICGSSFTQKGNFECHTRKHSGERPYKCQFCGKRFSQQQSLVIHTRRHTGTKPFKCKEKSCNMAFPDCGSLRKHVTAVHDIVENRHKCEECPKEFKMVQYLRMHIKSVHEQSRPFACAVCNSSFKQKSHLKKHLKCIHFKETDYYLCNQCGKEFRNKGYLKNHIRLKHNETRKHVRKNVACQQCDLLFKQASELELHVRLEHKDQLLAHKYRCEICDRSFMHSTKLEVHMQAHANEKWHTCFECGEAFFHLYDMETHVCGQTKSKPCKRPILWPEHASIGESVGKQSINGNNMGDVLYQCELCLSKFKLSCSLNEHYRVIHSGVVVLKCDMCEYSFATKHCLQKHIINSHGNTKALSEESGLKGVVLGPTESHTQINYKGKLINSCNSQTNRSTSNQFGSQSSLASPLEISLQLFNHCENGCLNGSRKCKHCEATFKVVGCLLSHIKLQHSRKRRHCCKRCNCTFTRKSELQKHIKVAHKMKEGHIKCNECLATFNQPWRLKNHIQIMHKSEIFITKKGIRESGKTTTGKPQPKYPNIAARVSTRRQTSHQCLQCSAAFNCANSLKKHVNDKHDKQLDTCMTELHVCEKPCEIKFGQESYFQSHVNFKHSREMDHCKKIQFKHEVLDATCDQKDIVQHSVDIHPYTATDNVTQFLCEVCGTEFMQADHLIAHCQAQHRNEVPSDNVGSLSLTQALCQSQQLECLANHVSDNGGSRIMNNQSDLHQCKYCPAAFVQADHLRTHITEDHSNEMNCRQSESYDWLQDNSEFQLSNRVQAWVKPTINDDVKAINSVQHGWFECEYCGAEFVQEIHLLTHITIQHSNTINDDKTNLQHFLKANVDIQSEMLANPSNTNPVTEIVNSVRHGWFQCKYCDAEFVQDCHLLAHVKVQHSDSVNNIQTALDGSVHDGVKSPASIPSVNAVIKVEIQ